MFLYIVFLILIYRLLIIIYYLLTNIIKENFI